MSRREELLKDIAMITAQYRAEVPSGHKAWPKSIKARVLELLASGMTSKAVAEATGIAYFTVHNWKRRAGTFRALQLAGPKEVPSAAKTPPILIVTITLPSGLKIEGLPAGEALRFARAFK